MKKIYFSIGLLGAFLSANAQQFVKQKDQFTGKEIKGVVVNMGKTIAPTGMMMGFGIINQKMMIYFQWPNPAGTFGAFNTMKVSDLSLLFKLDNDSIMKFKADTSTSKILNISNASILSISSEISQPDLKILSDHIIKVFRVGIKDDNGVDLDNKFLFTDKNKQQVKKAAAFMLE